MLSEVSRKSDAPRINIAKKHATLVSDNSHVSIRMERDA